MSIDLMENSEEVIIRDVIKTLQNRGTQLLLLLASKPFNSNCLNAHRIEP